MNKEKPALIHVGNNNFVNIDRIIAVASNKAAHIRRVLKEAETNGLALDFTGALPTRAIVVCDNGIIIRIALRPTDVIRALNQLDKVDD